MSLKEYRAKRDFQQSGEPTGETPSRRQGLYVVQKHDASHLHYDFRLQVGQVLKSWAIPKGPSLDPKVKRLAVLVEDHPVEYGDFEGVIPQGEYGGGTVMVWDRGRWLPNGDPAEGFRAGKLKFELKGEKLKGHWMLIRSHQQSKGERTKWLLIKERDERAESASDILTSAPLSVMSHRSLEDIASEESHLKGNCRQKKNSHSVAETLRPIKKVAGQKTLHGSQTAEDRPTNVGVKDAMPETITPQLATLVETPPAGTEWLNEIKFDGYRMICRIQDGEIRFISRNLQDWTSKLTRLVQLAKRLDVSDAIFDGEVVVLDSNGVSRFQLLQNAFRNEVSETIHYFMFDLLYLNGVSLSHLPLEQRKRRLKRVLAPAIDLKNIHYTDHVVGEGPALFREAKKKDLEGIISKQADRPYRPGRSTEWLKAKCHRREEFVIGGFTDPTGSREAFGALLLGYYKGDELRFAGKVGTGFSDAQLNLILKRLRALASMRSPFADLPKSGRPSDVNWVYPKTVVQVEFSNWTSDGKLRHPVFLGLRDDKPADQVVRDVPRRVRQATVGSKVSNETADSSNAQKRNPRPRSKVAPSHSSRKRP